jgi:hypothetical protein
MPTACRRAPNARPGASARSPVGRYPRAVEAEMHGRPRPGLERGEIKRCAEEPRGVPPLAKRGVAGR